MSAIAEFIGIIYSGEGYVQGIMPQGVSDGGDDGGGDDGEEPDAVLQSVWTAQTNLINQQIAYLDDIKTTFAEKRAHLPVGFSMDAFVESNFFKYPSCPKKYPFNVTLSKL